MKFPISSRWKNCTTLGRGGQATVFEVTDQRGEIPGRFALKALTPGKPPQAYARFAREIEVTRSIKHKGVISVVDHSTDEQCPFYVMEFHEGAVSLKRLIGTSANQFAGNPSLAVNLFMELMQALMACHNQQVVHRDLSPANILVLPDNSIKIIDFGLCQVSDGEQITLADEGVGTPNYIAPECESGSSVSPDIRADLYASGKILWAAIANRHGFAREAGVFKTMSMKNLFPLKPATWHLHDIFEKTIRNNPVNRWSHPEDAFEAARHVLYLVTAGFPAVELLDQLCPICGNGKLQDFEQSHMVFGNPNPRGIASLQCTNCHICLARDVTKARAEIARRAALS